FGLTDTASPKRNLYSYPARQTVKGENLRACIWQGQQRHLGCQHENKYSSNCSVPNLARRSLAASTEGFRQIQRRHKAIRPISPPALRAANHRKRASDFQSSEQMADNLLSPQQSNNTRLL